MKTTLLVPTLNELEGMKIIMPLVHREWLDQILIIDGQSSDGTVEYARAQGYDVYVQKKKGLRHAYIEGFPLVKGDWVITFSPDGNSPPEAIPRLIEAMKTGGHDMVIASRYKDWAKSADDDGITSLGNKLFTASINFLYGAHYTDAIVMYRIYKTKLFYDLDLHLEESYFMERWYGTVMGVEPLLSIRAVKAGRSIAEIPADEPKRIRGDSKLQVWRWGASYYTQVILEKFMWKQERASVRNKDRA